MISIASFIIIWCFSSTEYSISCSVCPSVFRQVDTSNYLSKLSLVHQKCLSPYPHTYLLTCRLSDVTSVYLPTHLFLGLFKLFHTIISSNALHVFFNVSRFASFISILLYRTLRPFISLFLSTACHAHHNPEICYLATAILLLYIHRQPSLGLCDY